MAVRIYASDIDQLQRALGPLPAIRMVVERCLECHSPIRKMCRLVGTQHHGNIERLSHASRPRLEAFINTVPTESNPSGYIIASFRRPGQEIRSWTTVSLDLEMETKTRQTSSTITQEASAMLEYLRASEKLHQ